MRNLVLMPRTGPPRRRRTGFAISSAPAPHRDRARALVRAHPEIRDLTGPAPITGAFVLLLVAAQVGIAWALRDVQWWLLAAAAWLVGAFLAHGLWVLIHDCTHNLVFRRPSHNHALQIFANLPLLLPAASAFRKFHILHHRHQGDPDLDVDLPQAIEARLIGHGLLGKALWMLNFWFFQSLRVVQLKRVSFVDRWYAANVVLALAFAAAVGAALGSGALLYLFLSAIFGIGLHPLGARWIQEHQLVEPDQETYSYYGPLNRVAFNVGYHNEHHDAVGVPWLRLPKVRRMAPEFYDGLYAHRSWTRIWLTFLFDPSQSLHDRMVRGVTPVRRNTAETHNSALD
jgi:sphingolipid delta-4 desaturase